MVDADKLIEWGFMAIVGTGLTLSTRFLSNISKSMIHLKVNIAAMIEKMNWHEKELERHDLRITKLERGRGGRA